MGIAVIWTETRMPAGGTLTLAVGCISEFIVTLFLSAVGPQRTPSVRRLHGCAGRMAGKPCAGLCVLAPNVGRVRCAGSGVVKGAMLQSVPAAPRFAASAEYLQTTASSRP